MFIYFGVHRTSKNIWKVKYEVDHLIDVGNLFELLNVQNCNHALLYIIDESYEKPALACWLNKTL